MIVRSTIATAAMLAADPGAAQDHRFEAEAVALSIFLLQRNVAPRAVRERLIGEFRYDLSPERAALSRGDFDLSAAGTVPPAFRRRIRVPGLGKRSANPSQPTAYLCPKAEDGNRRKSVLQRARQRSG
jgi:hypothetical protein